MGFGLFLLLLTVYRLSEEITTFAHSLVFWFWRTQTKQKGLTPANGINPNFFILIKIFTGQ